MNEIFKELRVIIALFLRSKKFFPRKQAGKYFRKAATCAKIQKDLLTEGRHPVWGEFMSKETWQGRILQDLQECHGRD